MNGATVLTKFTADTKDLDSKTKQAQKGLTGLQKAFIGGALGATLIGSAYATVGKAVVSMTKSAVESAGELEQSAGGIETIYKDAGMSVEALAKSFGISSKEAQKYYDELNSTGANVTENAKKAFQTAGISANEYMQQVTSFGASLMQALDGDTAEASRIANKAIIDMSDNANKMGTSIESIQNAYQGFAKQNYTMLDNLKLGYGGTKKEMERLLEDAEKISGIKYDISNLADVYSAIHVIQEEIGITGTTEKEASSTFQGSMKQLSASWQNFLSGAGDTSVLVKNVVDSLVGMIKVLIPMVVEIVPQLITGIVQLINAIVPKLPEIINQLLPAIIEGTQLLLVGLIEALPQIITAFAQMLPTFIPIIIDAIMAIIPALIENTPLFIEAGLQLIGGLIAGIVNSIPILLARIGEIIVKMIKAFKDISLIDVGKNILTGLWNGIKSMKDWVINKVKDLGKSILKGLKGILGIKSPSKEFALIGKFSVLGYTEALDDMQKDVQKQVGETFDISPQLANSSALNYTPNVQVVNNISMKQDPLGQMVNDIKTFSGGSKNDYNYGMGV
jgi:phage-related protein